MAPGFHHSPSGMKGLQRNSFEGLVLDSADGESLVCSPAMWFR
jgi:hypothetical protein